MSSSEENLQILGILFFVLFLVGFFTLYFSNVGLTPLSATSSDEDVGRISIEFLWDKTVRGMDTLIQMLVLFAAVLGIRSQFRKNRRQGDQDAG